MLQKRRVHRHHQSNLQSPPIYECPRRPVHRQAPGEPARRQDWRPPIHHNHVLVGENHPNQLLFLINNSAVYNLFVNLLELLYALGIAKLQPGTGYCEKCKNDDDEDETGGSCSQCQQRRQIEMLFLIENCIFSFQIAPHFFDRRFANIVHESESTLSMVLRKPRNMRAEGLSAFHDYLKSVLAAEHYQFTSSASCKHDNFPSDLVKFAIQRTDHAKLANYKSPASRKRNNNNFVMQRLAILIFRNGKMIVTGMQTCEDLETTFKILFAIVKFFF